MLLPALQAVPSLPAVRLTDEEVAAALGLRCRRRDSAGADRGPRVARRRRSRWRTGGDSSVASRRHADARLQFAAGFVVMSFCDAVRTKAQAPGKATTACCHCGDSIWPSLLPRCVSPVIQCVNKNSPGDPHWAGTGLMSPPGIYSLRASTHRPQREPATPACTQARDLLAAAALQKNPL